MTALFKSAQTAAEPTPAAESAPVEAAANHDDRTPFFIVGIAVAIVAALAIHRLRDFPYPLDWRGAFKGAFSMLPQTGWALVRVWSFLAIGVSIVGGLLLSVDPELGLGDAILGGAAGLWIGAFVIGQALGPIGLFRTASIWIILALGALWLWRRPPQLKLTPLDTGQKLALLTLALLAITMLPMQLASPVVPYMDVLSYPASVQRILTFGVYLPFDNDPYGQWGPYAQTPALELFYAAVALGSHSRLAVLAESAMMVPMAALIIFGTYRLGRTLFDPACGGMAALLLFLTCLPRRAQGMRGTAVDFALIGIGLAFFLDSRRSRIRIAVGALALGTAVASHGIIGGLAMIVAGGGLLLWLAEGDLAGFVHGIVCLIGASLLAVPEFAVGLAKPLPYPVLPLVQLAAIATIVAAAATLPPRFSEPRRSIAWLNWTLVLLLGFGILYRHATVRASVYEQVAGHLPMLMLFAFGGMLAMLNIWYREPGAMRYGGLAVFALLLAIAAEYLGEFLFHLTASPSVQMMMWDIVIKSWDYWSPYFLLFPAGFLFALFYQRWSKPITILALLTLLIYPWRQMPNATDYDSDEHSISQLWGFNLATATFGYWNTSNDPRWSFGPNEFALLRVLDAEIAAGRITLATHLLHIAPNTSPWVFAHVSVFDGVDEDPVEVEAPQSSLWQAGSRVREIGKLSEALAAKPPYILDQVNATEINARISDDYDEIFHRGDLTLFRRRDLAPGAPSKNS
ncbi:MAG TPA: hypothetical protein VMB26_05850 [Candidatus Binataceae bacterium]|nr:hypothetical protein [Candidatus Binataceae bacterium]